MCKAHGTLHGASSGFSRLTWAAACMKGIVCVCVTKASTTAAAAVSEEVSGEGGITFSRP